jgi:ketosteroid isomerase-like protein
MKSTSNVSDLIRKIFSTYETKDRKTCEDLLSDDFTFSSPRDDHISKTTYFERCWPNSEKFRAIHIEKLFEKDNEAFVRYRAELKDGTSFRNTEFIRVEGNKIREVDVYFGRSLSEGAQEG